jgi:hypothetical protein
MKAHFRIIILMATLFVGLPIGVFLFGQLVHEESHALACLFFKVPFIFSSSHVDTIPLTGIPSMVIGLSGGIGEALVSLLFFRLMTIIEKQKGKWFWGAIGFEIAFLAMVFTGVANSIWEGFFNKSYQANFNNNIAVLSLLSSALILSTYILVRQKQIIKRISILAPSDEENRK